MEKWKKPASVIAFLGAATCLVVGSARAGTVRIQTSSGAGACATYYTQSGDRATGDATVSSTGSVDLNTEGSVQMGLVRGGSSPGSGSFAPFTGDFSASASSSGGASAHSANPRADIFVVSQPGNSTLGNYTIDGNPGTPYTRFNTLGADIGAVDAAGGENNGLPDWILVDQGTYNERVTMDNTGPDSFEDNSALTSAWCADNTIVNAAGGGHGVSVNSASGFRMEGLTVTGAELDGIHVDGSPNAQILCNTATLSGDDGIDVEDSDDALIRRNTVTGNSSHGISVDRSGDAQITDNEVTQNVDDGIRVYDSGDAEIRRNTVTENFAGITAVLNTGVKITDNTVTDNTLSGIAALVNGSVQIADNTVTDSFSGILAVGNGSKLTISGVGANAGTAAGFFALEGSVETALNAVTDSLSGTPASIIAGTQIDDNAVADAAAGTAAALNALETGTNILHQNLGGLSATLPGLASANSVAAGNALSQSNANVEITGNTVRDNASGIVAALNNVELQVAVNGGVDVGVTPVAGANTVISDNEITDGASGILTVFNPNTEISENNVTGNEYSGIAAVLNNVDVQVTLNGGVDVSIQPAAGANTVISGNEVTDNFSGILTVFDPSTDIYENDVSDNFSGILTALSGFGLQVTVNGGTTIDLTPVPAGNTVIRDNEVTDNLSGIAAVGNLLPVIGRNEVTGNISGIATVLNAIPVIAVNEVTDNLSGIAAVGNLVPVVAGNEVTENVSGIAAVLNAVPVIAGNEVSQNDSGIAAVANYIPVIAGNTVTDNLGAISVVGNNWVPPLGSLPENRAIVIGNTVTDNAWNGIWVRSSDHAGIAENTVTGNQGNGIRVRNSDDAQILGNTVVDNSRSGIRTTDCDDTVIRGNNIIGNNVNNSPTHGGVSVTGSSTGTEISLNNIAGNRNAGVYNDSGNSVNAIGNWWGDGSGPTIPSNPDGGDAIINSGAGSTTDWSPAANLPFPIP